MDRRLQVAKHEVLVGPVDGVMVEHKAGGLGEVGVVVCGDGFGLTMLGVK